MNFIYVKVVYDQAICVTVKKGHLAKIKVIDKLLTSPGHKAEVRRN